MIVFLAILLYSPPAIQTNDMHLAREYNRGCRIAHHVTIDGQITITCIRPITTLDLI